MTKIGPDYDDGCKGLVSDRADDDDGRAGHGGIEINKIFGNRGNDSDLVVYGVFLINFLA